MSRHKNEAPQWHGIEALPLIKEAIEGTLENSTEHYATLQEAIPRPYVLDNHTVNRILKVFGDQQGDLPLFDEQLQRWQALTTITQTQRQQVTRLQAQMVELTETTRKILDLAHQLKKGSIKAELDKSDLQVGLESLFKERQ